MYVVTMDQRNSRDVGDMVPQLVRQLRHIPAVIEFQRSVSDEVQGVTIDAADAITAALSALRGGSWSVGIGVGRVDDPLPERIVEASGYGMVYSRRAAERALKIHDQVPLAVEGLERDLAAESEAVLRLLGRIVAVRSQSEWNVVDLMIPGVRGQQKAVAAELGITPQAVSKAVVRSLWQEEWAARPAAARLLGLLDSRREILI
ncbi:hypothetical protein [Arthrobacter sp. H14]|uniref:hypothetical protein n=1 Tax=Arthrobacter sp. H14 TaxID=1312959 RepID=UPI0004790794|nr:hypothetical protein [Arthrobacter sp. H14]